MLVYLFALLFLGFNWATGYVIAGFCITHGMNPSSYAFWQSFGPFVCLAIFAILKQKKVNIDKSSLKFYLFCAIFATILPSMLVYYSASHVSSVFLNVFSNISSLVIYTLAVVFGGERFRPLRFSFVILGIIGVLLIISGNPHDLFVNWQQSSENIWLYLLLLVPFCYSISVIYIDRLANQHISYTSKAVGMLFFASLGLLPLALHDGLYIPNLYDVKTQLLLLEIIISVIDALLIFFIISSSGATYYSMVSAITALFGVMYGYIIYGRAYESGIYIAIALIVVSIIGINLTQKNR